MISLVCLTFPFSSIYTTKFDVILFFYASDVPLWVWHVCVYTIYSHSFWQVKQKPWTLNISILMWVDIFCPITTLSLYCNSLYWGATFIDSLVCCLVPSDIPHTFDLIYKMSYMWVSSDMPEWCNVNSNVKKVYVPVVQIVSVFKVKHNENWPSVDMIMVCLENWPSVDTFMLCLVCCLFLCYTFHLESGSVSIVRIYAQSTSLDQFVSPPLGHVVGYPWNSATLPQFPP